MAARHYIAVFPRTVDKPRPAWPRAVMNRALAVPGVVDATFSDLSSTWLADPARAGESDADVEREIRSESRRRFVELYASADTPEVAKQTDDAVRAFIVELKGLVGAESVTLVRMPIDYVERL